MTATSPLFLRPVTLLKVEIRSVQHNLFLTNPHGLLVLAATWSSCFTFQAVTCYLPRACEMCICSRICASLKGRWGSFPIPISQEEIIFNVTATCCFNLRGKFQGSWGTRAAAELSRAQAHPGWKDLVGSVLCHCQSWNALGGPRVGVEGYRPSGSLGNAAQKHVG